MAPLPILQPSPRMTFVSSAPSTSHPDITRTLSSRDPLTAEPASITASVRRLPLTVAPSPRKKGPSMAHPGALQSLDPYSASAMARFAPSRSLGLPTSIQMPSTLCPWILLPSAMSLGTRSFEKS